MNTGFGVAGGSNLASNPNNYSAVTMDGSSSSIISVATQALQYGYVLRLLNAASANDLTVTNDGTATATLAPDSIAAFGSGNSVVYNGTSLTNSIGNNADTSISGPANGQVLSYNSSTQKWSNAYSAALNHIYDTNGNLILNLVRTPNAVNFISIDNQGAGGSPLVAAAGSDANANLWLAPQAFGGVILADQHNARVVVAQGGSNNPVNYLILSNSGTNSPPRLSASGTDTNINVQIDPQGTGSLDLNSHSIINVSDPVNPQDVATMHYVTTNTSTLGANTFTGDQTAPAFVASGLTGATATSRYVGATASGMPTTGTFVVGDFVVDHTGQFWICTVGGTPGTWAAAQVSLDTVSTDIQPVGTGQLAGSVGKAADAGHTHPLALINSWQPTTAYAQGQFLSYLGFVYQVSAAFTSGASFSLSNLNLIHAPVPGNPVPSGQYIFPGGGQNVGTSSTLGVGTVRVFPWYLPNACTLTAIGAEVTAAGDAGSVYRLGIYSDTGSFQPGSLVLDADTISGTSLSVQSIGISQALSPGVYWIGGAVQNVTTTQPTLRTFGPGPFALPMSTQPAAGISVAGYSNGTLAAGSLPGSFSVGGTLGAIPRIHVKG